MTSWGDFAAGFALGAVLAWGLTRWHFKGLMVAVAEHSARLVREHLVAEVLIFHVAGLCKIGNCRCTRLEGTAVAKGGHFFPPLHDGCHCFVTIAEKNDLQAEKTLKA